MSTLSTSFAHHRPDTWQDALRLIGGFALFWALAAGLLYLAAPGLETFGRLLVIHECTGTMIVICVLLLRRMHLLPKANPALRWLLAGLIAIPTGYLVGHILAFLLLGDPVRFMSSGSDRMVPIVFTLLVAGFGLYFYATREQLAMEAAARSDAQRLAAESQLRMLRAQLEPHMLFNTLANLRSLMSEDSRQAEVMIDRLITYLRSALAASRTESTTLRSEFTQLGAYLDIMSLRMGPRFTYTLALPDALGDTRIPPMLLQPLVENAIKHGIEPKVGKGHIDVIARRTADGIEISVVDTGLGLPPDAQPPATSEPDSGSYGLLHVRERLAVTYGSNASLALRRREPTGVCAVIHFPS